MTGVWERWWTGHTTGPSSHDKVSTGFRLHTTTAAARSRVHCTGCMRHKGQMTSCNHGDRIQMWVGLLHQHWMKPISHSTVLYCIHAVQSVLRWCLGGWMISENELNHSWERSMTRKHIPTYVHTFISAWVCVRSVNILSYSSPSLNFLPSLLPPSSLPPSLLPPPSLLLPPSLHPSLPL